MQCGSRPDLRQSDAIALPERPLVHAAKDCKGRARQFATFGCSRSAAILSRPSAGARNLATP